MKARLTWTLALFLTWTYSLSAAYQEKEQPQPPNAKDGYGTLPSNTNLPPSRVGDLYPYYGNTPEEMIPYRGIEPYHRYWTKRLPFRGPGRDDPDPPDLKSLKVGLLVPPNYGPEGARGQRTRRGVMLAFDEADAVRKSGQLPFEIVYREDSPQWGSAANIAVDFKDNDVLGFIGTIDGDATHVALRVTLKIETPMINTSDPDPTLTETQIPWLTRIFPDDRQQCWRLAYMIIKQRGCKRVAILRESSRPGRVGVMHFANDIRRLGYPPVAHLLYKANEHDLASQLQTIKAAEPDAVLFYGQPGDIGYAVATLRKDGIQAQFFGFDRLKEDSFLKSAGPAAEGMTITYFFNPDKTDQPWVEFVQRYQKRWGEKPDIYAAYGYDGAKLMIEAINHAGPNRFRVRDYLANLEEWNGATGHMIFDARWDNIVPISTAQYKQGKWHFEPFPELKRPQKAQPAKLSQLAETARLLADEPAPAPMAVGLLVSPEESETASLRQGATLGIEHANQTPGARTRLVVRGQPGQWGTEGDEAAVLALDEEVGAIIAPSTGTPSHQILQVAGRTRVPVASLCPDFSVTGTGIPWLLRIVPRGDEEARTLFTGLTHGSEGKPLRWAALVPRDRAGREAARDLLAAAKAAACFLDEPVRLPPKSGDFSSVAGNLLASRPAAILLWTDPAAAGRMAQSLRQAGFRGLLAGPGRLRSPAFLSTAGKAAEGVVIPAIFPTQDSMLRRPRFTEEYRRRFANEPDFTAEMAYDAARLLTDVLRTSCEQPPCRAFPLQEIFPGISGPLSFDRQGNRLVTLALLTCRDGQFKPFATVGSNH